MPERADAWSLVGSPESASLPLLVHVPHGSRSVPAPWRHQIVLSDAELEDEILAMTDLDTEALFCQGHARDGVALVNRTSRLVFDPERFEDDGREAMARCGMGAVYTRTADGRPLRAIGFSDRDRERVLTELFRPYARAVERAVDRLLDRFGRCLIVDGHSFPTRPLPYEDATLERPDICLGYEAPHASAPLVARLARTVRAHGLSCAENTPFAGSYVPTRHFGRDTRVGSVMIEVRRGLYVDEATGERNGGFAHTQQLVRALLSCAADAVR